MVLYIHILYFFSNPLSRRNVKTFSDDLQMSGHAEARG